MPVGTTLLLVVRSRSGVIVGIEVWFVELRQEDGSLAKSLETKQSTQTFIADRHAFFPVVILHYLMCAYFFLLLNTASSFEDEREAQGTANINQYNGVEFNVPAVLPRHLLLPPATLGTEGVPAGGGYLIDKENMERFWMDG